MLLRPGGPRTAALRRELLGTLARCQSTGGLAPQLAAGVGASSATRGMRVARRDTQLLHPPAKSVGRSGLRHRLLKLAILQAVGV
jgi:hypothetical protein